MLKFKSLKQMKQLDTYRLASDCGSSLNLACMTDLVIRILWVASLVQVPVLFFIFVIMFVYVHVICLLSALGAGSPRAVVMGASC